MGVDADRASRALLDTWRLLTHGVPGGWTADEDGALAAVSGVGVPTLNGVWVGDAGCALESVSGLLDRVGVTGLPHCLQGRQRAATQLGRLAEARGMTWAEDIPLMVSTDAPGPDRALQAIGRQSTEVVASEQRSPRGPSPMASGPAPPGRGCGPAPLGTGSTHGWAFGPSNTGPAGSQEAELARP